MPVNKTTKMLAFVQHRVRVSLVDGRAVVGTLLAFDRHMNLVLNQAEEFRLKKKRKRDKKEISEQEDRRVLGMLLLRGENVVSIQEEVGLQDKFVKKAAKQTAT